MRYIVADDERHVRAGLVSLVAEVEPTAFLAGESDSGRSTDELIRRSRPDLALVDVRMPDGSGLGAIRNAASISPGTIFVIVSSYSQFDYARQALQLGAFDYLIKPVALGEMQSLIHRVHSELSRRSAASAQNRMSESVPGSPASASGRTQPPAGPAELSRRLIEEQYDQDIGISQIAAQAGVTLNYLSTLFRERFGVTPLQHLTKVRLEHAAELLSAGFRVKEVASRVGYHDVKYFSSRFTEHFGVKPSRYGRE